MNNVQNGEITLELKGLSLVNNKAIIPNLVEAGRKTVVERFTMERMIDQIEEHLNQTIAQLEPIQPA